MLTAGQLCHAFGSFPGAIRGIYTEIMKGFEEQTGDISSFFFMSGQSLNSAFGDFSMQGVVMLD
jgi:hypothetical protein